MSIQSYTEVYRALAEPNRLRIIKMLEVKPLCVCEITEVLQLAASTVSKHLSILRDAGLIIDQKDGKWVNYCLNDSPDQQQVRQLLHLLADELADDEVVRTDAGKAAAVDRLDICDI